jgi:NADPH-dependent 2,4-dienoyl-CoA reductase/sulfur reductase-like enzyme
MPITCAINPSVGREEETEITPASVRKRVMVIGGGIAGMEAARVAAMRGHTVALYEKEPQLGGQLQIAAKAPGRADMAEPVRYYEKQFEKLGVQVHLGAAVDEELVRREAPEAVIVATGGLPALLPIEGIGDGAGLPVVLARDVLAGTAEVAGERVIVFATDQGMEGLTTADYLSDRGKQVEVLIPYPTLGAKLEMITGMMITARLARKNVKLSIMTGVKAVRDGAIIAFNPFSMREWPIEGVDTLVVSAGSRANDALWKALRGQVKEVHGAGECVAPRKLLDSTLDGLRTGLAV